MNYFLSCKNILIIYIFKNYIIFTVSPASQTNFIQLVIFTCFITLKHEFIIKDRTWIITYININLIVYM